MSCNLHKSNTGARTPIPGDFYYVWGNDLKLQNQKLKFKIKALNHKLKFAKRTTEAAESKTKQVEHSFERYRSVVEQIIKENNDELDDLKLENEQLNHQIDWATDEIIEYEAQIQYYHNKYEN